DYLDAMVGVCYDGVEGVLYLCLFSILAACAFTVMLCAIPRALRQIASRERDYDDIDEEDPFNPRARRIGSQNPNHANLHSFCSYSSSMGSQNSLHPPAPTVSNHPMSEYMNQTALFGGNPRYENVPLIGRGSPPPSYSPTMRATYLSMTEEQSRHFGSDFQA
ncbi:Protein tweety 2, partial [Characodon lateralis]|nr:Protein tweety 2 [Characodon lateralis]